VISVIIPSRQETFLAATVEDLLEKAMRDIEVIVVLDGPCEDPGLPDDSRVRVIRHSKPLGMRACINDGVAIAEGEYLMKCDAHCIFAYDFDRFLVDYTEDNWLVIPRRWSIDGENWVVNDQRSFVDYEHFNYPHYKPPHIGLYTVRWHKRRDKHLGSSHHKIDDNMAFQGSCWLTTADHFRNVIGRLDEEYFGMWAGEPQEMGLKTWLSGGRVVVNKFTWYAHLHKGRHYKTYNKNRTDISVGMARVVDYWMNNKWEGRANYFEWLVDKFWPIPTWPEDWMDHPVPDWEEVLRINRG
jgi:glycosyltransferase involved in cell wall biosynthesis